MPVLDSLSAKAETVSQTVYGSIQGDVLKVVEQLYEPTTVRMRKRDCEESVGVSEQKCVLALYMELCF